MSDNQKPFAPLNTGIIEGIGWGVITDLLIQSVAVATVATVAIATGATTVAAMTASPLILGISAVGAVAAGVGGIVNGIKTVIEKRQEWEQASTTISSSSVEAQGRVSGNDLSVKR
jgi:hypothetical protein